MLHKVLCLTVVLLWGALQGQTTNSLENQKNQEYHYQLKNEDVLSLHTSTSGYRGSVRKNKKSFLLDIFNTKQEKIYSQSVKKEKREHFVGELFSNNEIKFFTVVTSERTERIIYCHTFNINTKTYKKTILLEKNSKPEEQLFSGTKRNFKYFAISENGKYLVMNINTDKQSNTIFVYHTASLGLVFTKEYNNTDRYFEHNDIFIDNEGFVYTLGKSFEEFYYGFSCNESTKYEYILHKITKDEVNKLSIKTIKDKRIRSLAITSKNDELQLIGIYSKWFSKELEGGCHITVNPEKLTILDTKMEELPIEFSQDVVTKKAKRKQEEASPDYNIDYIFTDANGNTFLLAEEFFIKQYRISTGSIGGYCRTIYNYNDVIIYKFDSNGDLAWTQRIPKKGLSHSYNAFVSNNELHVILDAKEVIAGNQNDKLKMTPKKLGSKKLYDFSYSDNDHSLTYKTQKDNGSDKFKTGGL